MRSRRRGGSLSKPQHGLALLVLLCAPIELGSESLTLHSYYPSPLGIYTSLTTTSQTLLARDGGAVGVGTPSPQAALDVNGILKLGTYSGNPPGTVPGAVAGGLYYDTSSNQLLANDGFHWNPVGAGGGGWKNYQKFTANGNFTVPAGATKIMAWLHGGGGGGGGGGSYGLAASGGGGGCFDILIAAVSPGQSLPITIGAAGGGGTASTGILATDGGAGGATTMLGDSAGGGGAGLASSSGWIAPGGAGGACSGNGLFFSGNPGSVAGTTPFGSGASVRLGGAGGTPGYGGGAGGAQPTGGAAGNPAVSSSGAGGGGGAGPGGGVYGGPGGAGGAGYAIVWW